MDDNSPVLCVPGQSGAKQKTSEERPATEAREKSDPVDEIYEVILGHRRYFAVKVDGVEVSVRVPLHIFESKNPKAYEEYAEELIRKCQAEKRKKFSQAWNNKQRMRKLVL